jgi:hypothetical protein
MNMIFKKIISGTEFVRPPVKSAPDRLSEVRLFMEHLKETKVCIRSVYHHLSEAKDRLSDDNAPVNKNIKASLIACCESTAVLLKVLRELGVMENAEKRLLELMQAHPELVTRPEFGSGIKDANIDERQLTDNGRLVFHALDFYKGFYRNTFACFLGNLQLLEMDMSAVGGTEIYKNIFTKIPDIAEVGRYLIDNTTTLEKTLRQARSEIILDLKAQNEKEP